MKEEPSISVFIVEDNEPARELLIEYIINRQELKLEGIARNGDEALQKLSKRNYDLLFLDVNLPLKSGIEVLEELDPLPYIIFTTAFDKYAIKAFDLGAVDYLLKPFSEERFNQAVDKAISLLKKNQISFDYTSNIHLSFKDEHRHQLVPFEDIIFLTANGRSTIIHTNNKNYETTQLLKDVGAKLPGDIFIRIHKKYIINTKYLSQVEYIIGGQYEISLNDEDRTKLPVGRKYSPDLKKRLLI